MTDAELRLQRKHAEERVDWNRAISRARAELPDGYSICLEFMRGDVDFYLAGPEGKVIDVGDYDGDATWVLACLEAALQHKALKGGA